MTNEDREKYTRELDPIKELLKDAFKRMDKDSWNKNSDLLKSAHSKIPKEFKRTQPLCFHQIDVTIILDGATESELTFVDWEFSIPITIAIHSKAKISFIQSNFSRAVNFNFSRTWTPYFFNTTFSDKVWFMPPSAIQSKSDPKLINSRFHHCTFKNGCVFQGIQFAGETEFKSCAFDQEPNTHHNKHGRKRSFNSWQNNEVVFMKSVFEKNAYFIDSTFNNIADFRRVSFCNKVYFIDTLFLFKLADFHKATFGGEAYFEGCGFYNKTTLDLSSSVFRNTFYFIKDNYWKDSALITLRQAIKEKDYDKIKKIKDDLRNRLKLETIPHFEKINILNALFEGPVIFDLKFQSCPDFSKAHFLKYYSIAETWLEQGRTIPDSEITKDDVEKFRFFKNYFEKNGNHFKEREYFAYEMNAVEKRKKFELKHPKKAEEKPSKDCWLKRFFSGRRWKKRLCLSRLKFRWRRFFDLDSWLFGAYKKNSNFGIGIWEPFRGLLVSGLLFFLGFSIFFQEEFTQKPQTASTQIINTTEFVCSGEAKHLMSLSSERITRDPSAAPQDDKCFGASNQNTETCKKIISTIAAKTLLLTFNPLASFKILKNGGFWLVVVGVLQAFINATLLFLLALGLRNRFKLK